MEDYGRTQRKDSEEFHLSMLYLEQGWPVHAIIGILRRKHQKNLTLNIALLDMLRSLW
jgi:hypothetical protein